MTKKRLSFVGSQTLLASENESKSTGDFNSTETVGNARRLVMLSSDFVTAKLANQVHDRLPDNTAYNCSAYFVICNYSAAIFRVGYEF